MDVYSVLFLFCLYICVCVCLQIQGPLPECCSIRPGVSVLPITAYHLYTFLRDNVVYWKTNRKIINDLQYVPYVIGVLSVWRFDKPKTKKHMDVR